MPLIFNPISRTFGGEVSVGHGIPTECSRQAERIFPVRTSRALSGRNYYRPRPTDFTKEIGCADFSSNRGSPACLSSRSATSVAASRPAPANATGGICSAKQPTVKDRFRRRVKNQPTAPLRNYSGITHTTNRRCRSTPARDMLPCEFL